MSETEALPAVAVKQVPSDKGEERFEVTFGSPVRRLEVVELDLGAQFELAEVTGGNVGNVQWMNMAFVAASVASIDGVPQPTGAWNKRGLRETLRRLGLDGLRAAGLVIGGYRGGSAPAAASDSEDTHKGAVGN